MDTVSKSSLFMIIYLNVVILITSVLCLKKKSKTTTTVIYTDSDDFVLCQEPLESTAQKVFAMMIFPLRPTPHGRTPGLLICIHTKLTPPEKVQEPPRRLPLPLQPRKIELNPKECLIKDGLQTGKHAYPTLDDIKSDWGDKDEVQKGSDKNEPADARNAPKTAKPTPAVASMEDVKTKDDEKKDDDKKVKDAA